MRLILILLCFSIFVHSVCEAGSVPEGGPCSIFDGRLNPMTLKFMTDCDDKTFCDQSFGNRTCQLKRCRRDEFPFGYDIEDIVPPLCPHGSYCPDEESGCQPLIEVDEPCQLSRDEQCTPPENWQELESSQNFYGAMCLQSKCMYANATIGQRCVLEEMTYIDVSPYNGEQFVNKVYRHNCQTPQLYCDPNALQCFETKPTGAKCALHIECQTLTCGKTGVCTNSPGLATPLRGWQYFVGALVVTVVLVTLSVYIYGRHEKDRVIRHQELHDYYKEQMSLRQSMFSLHDISANDKYID